MLKKSSGAARRKSLDEIFNELQRWESILKADDVDFEGLDL